MIYLNNAGTSWPKPKEMNIAMTGFQELSPLDWNNAYKKNMHVISDFFNVQPSIGEFLFTGSCTAALALAMGEFSWKAGDKLLISSLEHHALGRWFHLLQLQRGIIGIQIPRSESSPLDLNVLEDELKKGARMVAFSMASNLTGEILPYKEIIDLTKRYGTKCLLDGAQLAGIVPIDLTALKPDFFVFAGHKGTLGPQGIGGLYLANSIQMDCPNAVCEINLGNSPKYNTPSFCDVGSLNMAAMYGLSAGLNWHVKKGWEFLQHRRIELTARLRSGLSQLEDIRILGNESNDHTSGAVAVHSDKHDLALLHKVLLDRHKIVTSFGYQCAPMAHETMKSDDTGALRISVGPETTMEELDVLLDILEGSLT